MSDEKFSAEFIPKSNWFKFDKVGANIRGTYFNRFEKAGDGTMPDQVVFELSNVEINGKKEDGEWKVPVKASNKYILDRLKLAKLGQRMGFEFKAEIPAKVQGMNPAKSIQPYLWGMDATYTAKEVFGGEDVAADVPFK